MSHVKNLQAFGKLMGYCTGYGGKYNPGQQNLQVNALATLLNNAQQKNHDVHMAAIAYDHAVNDRATRVADMLALVSRVMNLLKTMNLPDATLKDARTIVRSIRVRPAQPPATVTNPEVPSVAPRARGGDYTTRINRFGMLVNFVASLHYKPNEEELSLKSLRQVLTGMQQANDRVTAAEVALNNARNERDVLMYQGRHSLVRTALVAKRYIQGLFGTTSNEYRDVGSIRFTNP